MLTGLGIAVLIYMLVAVSVVAVHPRRRDRRAPTNAEAGILLDVVTIGAPDFPIDKVFPFLTVLRGRQHRADQHADGQPADLRHGPARTCCRAPSARCSPRPALAVGRHRLHHAPGARPDHRRHARPEAGPGGGHLSGTTALLLLGVFTIVNIACLVLRRDPTPRAAFRAPTHSRSSARCCCVYLLGPWARPRRTDPVQDRRRAARRSASCCGRSPGSPTAASAPRRPASATSTTSSDAPADTAGCRTRGRAPPSTVGRVTRRPVAPVLAMLLAGAIGCSTVTPPAPSASAVPDSDPPALTFTAPPVEPSTVPSSGDRSTSTVGPAAERGPRDRPSVPAAPELAGAYRFVSAPDFLNQDVADLTADGRKEFVDKRTGEVANSTNDDVRRGAGPRDRRDGVARHRRRPRGGRPRRGTLGPRRRAHRRLRAGADPVPAPAWPGAAPRTSTSRPGVSGSRTAASRPTPPSADHEIGDDPWRARNTRGSTSSAATSPSSSGSTPTTC